MTGAVDLSSGAARAMTAGEEADLWARARAAGVLVRIVELPASGWYLATVDGRGAAGRARATDPYHAAVAAIARAAQDDRLARLEATA